MYLAEWLFVDSAWGYGLIAVVVLLYLAAAFTICGAWEQMVVMTLGRFSHIARPGVTLILPGLMSRVKVDMRQRITSLTADETLTADAVTVSIEAVLFWQVMDARKAILGISNYAGAIQLAAQTALREVIGGRSLRSLLGDHDAMDEAILDRIRRKIGDWGIDVQRIDIRDVTIPEDIAASMSRQAQAEAEKAARITLAEAEVGIAQKTAEAARVYATQPGALEIRGMNILFEMNKARGATIVVPSSMVNSLGGAVLAEAVRQAQQAESREDTPPPAPNPAAMTR